MALRTSERVKTRANPLSRAESRRVAKSTAQAIPLDLAPLLAPYAKFGRLSLRFEQMPQNSRLSRGRNNGDRSWSIAPEELDKIEYLPPENAEDSHSLSIRVVGLDQDGATLAILNVPVAIEPAQAGVTYDEPAASGNVVPLNQQSYDEIEKLRALLAERESELADFHAGQSDELQKHLAAAKVLFERMLEEKRKDWLGEQETHIETLERRAAERMDVMRESWQHEMDETLARAETAWEAGEAFRLATAGAEQKAKSTEAADLVSRSREDWQHETELKLAQAEAAWKADEASRLVAAELQWKVQSTLELNDVRERCARSEAELARVRAEPAAKPDTDALRRVQDELQSAKADLANRNSALTDVHAALAKGDGGENQRLRTELSAARRTIENKDASFVAAEQAFERAQESWRRESDDRLAKAKTDWEKSVTVRLAAAEAETRAQSEDTLSEMAGRLREAERELGKSRSRVAELASLPSDKEEIESLRVQVMTFQVSLAEREQEVAHARLILEQSELRTPNKRITLYSDRMSEGATPAQLQAGLKRSRHMAFDLVLVAILVVLVTWFLPQIEALLPDSWVYNIDLATVSVETMFGRTVAPIAVATQAVRAPSAAAAPVKDLYPATLVRSAKLHAGAEATAPAITTLQHGTSVVVVAQRGNWTLVRADNKTGVSQQGWIYSSYLQRDNAKKTTPSKK